MPKLAGRNRMGARRVQRAYDAKGTTRSVAHATQKRGKKERDLEETKRVLHEFEEKQGDWSKAR